MDNVFATQVDHLIIYTYTVTYSGRLGDWYTGLGAPTLTPERHFSSFLFSVVFQQKIS